MRNNRGVTLLTMAIVIIIMFIILGTITFDIMNRSKMQKLDDLYNNLQILSGKINIYYNQYGTLPVKEEYTEVSRIPSDILNPNDYGKYYIIDLNAIENLSLMTNVKPENIYVINEVSHTIYFPSGVDIEGEKYYRLPEEYTKVPATVSFSYTLEPETPSQETVIHLTVEELMNGLEELTFPDGNKKKYDDNTKRVEETHKVTENGNYIFEVIVKNTGETVTITVPVSNIDREGPTYDRAETSNVTSAGYDVMIYGVTDPSGVAKVEIEAWTSSNGKDDVVIKQMSYQENGNWYGRVSVDEHSNQSGAYETKIYMYDTLGNKSEVTLNAVTVPQPTHTHSMGSWTKLNDTQHQRSCSCGLTETANHNWGTYTKVNDTTHKRTCTICGAEQNAEHNFGNWSSASESQHQRSCLLCNGTVNQNHSFGSFTYVDTNSHKQVCSICSYTNSVAHTWGSFVSVDDNTHKRTCSGCGNVQNANHSWSAYTSTGATTHQRTCNTCGKVQAGSHTWSSYVDNGDGTHSRTCSTCGAIDAAAHSFSSWKRISYYQHARSCTVCGKTEAESHTGTGSTYTYVDTTYHKRPCTKCDWAYSKHQWVEAIGSATTKMCKQCKIHM